METKQPSPWYYRIRGTVVKKLKPCMPGDQVHITSMQGCFKVHRVTLDHFIIIKQRAEIAIEWNEFVCLKGEGTSDISMMKREILHRIQTVRAQEDLLLRTLNDIKKRP